MAAIREWSIRKATEVKRQMPPCGARRRTNGEPCRNPAMENGRCRFHGGLTPRGKDWHRPAFAGCESLEKLNRKLDDLDKRRTARAARVASMTPEERERHEAWQRSHKPGSSAERAARRRSLAMRAEIEAAAGKPQQAGVKAPRTGAAALVDEAAISLGGPCKERASAMPANENPSDVRQESLRRIQTEALEAAVDAAVELLRDPKAPSQAKSATINAVFRASGMFSGMEAEGGDLENMTTEQLIKVMSRLDERANELEKAIAESEAPGAPAGAADDFFD